MTYMGLDRRAGSDRRADVATATPRVASSGQSASSHKYDARMQEMRDRAHPPSPVAPGLLIGLGLGGLVDGIVFRRLLDWQHALSADTPMTGTGLADNLRGDGLFDTVALIALVVGMALMWQAALRLSPRANDRSGLRLSGWMLLGWSGYLAIEGAVFHLGLGWHHVNETPGVNEAAWDWGLLIAAIAVGLIGLAMTRAQDATLGLASPDRPGRDLPSERPPIA